LFIKYSDAEDLLNKSRGPVSYLSVPVRRVKDPPSFAIIRPQNKSKKQGNCIIKNVIDLEVCLRIANLFKCLFYSLALIVHYSFRVRSG